MILTDVAWNRLHLCPPVAMGKKMCIRTEHNWISTHLFLMRSFFRLFTSFLRRFFPVNIHLLIAFAIISILFLSLFGKWFAIGTKNDQWKTNRIKLSQNGTKRNTQKEEKNYLKMAIVVIIFRCMSHLWPFVVCVIARMNFFCFVISSTITYSEVYSGEIERERARTHSFQCVNDFRCLLFLIQRSFCLFVSHSII